jgi:DNA-binding transcriptional regulator/RsmH inhibitor MraZ
MDAKLLEHAGITDSIAFLGKNQIFELWEPIAADAMIEAARARAQARAVARRQGA